ncbi:hypothetical protein ACFVP8_21365 [Viridibacillus arvi]|uniref:hypothetical protein n=1 Tax=Viridibacillus arvi TaxID=263475 RepID=UPI0036CA03E0
MTSLASNKMLKVFLFISTLFLVLISSNIVANAADNSGLPTSESLEDLELSTNSQYSLPTKDGGTITFQSEEDMQSYLNDNNNDTRCATCNQTTQTILEKSTASRQFINYHPATPNWEKADSVSLAGGVTYGISGSYGYGGTTFGINFAHTVTATRTFNSTQKGKYIRLGVRKDISYLKVKNVVKNPVGTIINTYITETATPVGDTYIELMYKS